MTLTHEESQEQYKKNMLGRSRYTPSPLKDDEVYSQTENSAKERLGEEKYDKMKKTKNKDYESSVEDDLGAAKESLNFDIYTKKILDTEHLPRFELFEEDLGLIGDELKAMKKNLYYFQNSVMQNIRGYTINKKVSTDNKSNMLIFGSAGSGKTTIKNQVKRILKDEEGVEGCYEVSGLSHAEQLVGKMKYKGKGKDKIATPVPGIEAYRCVMNDESQDMLNEKNELYAKAQRIRRLAQDTYPHNKISKKLVDDSPDDVFEYNSPARHCDFAHPEKLKSPFFDTGSFRRYFAYILDCEQNINIDDVTEFILDDSDEETRESWKDFLVNHYNKQVWSSFTQDTLNIISHFHKCLLIYLLNHKNKNAFRFGLLTRYSMREMFCKYVLILSQTKKEMKVENFTAITACRDVLLFILKTIETYNELGDIGASRDVWGGVDEESAQALEYLFMNGATSLENSSISVSKFQTILGHFYGCKPTQSRKYQYKLKKEGFIDTKQVGQYDSRVWLKFIPKDFNIELKDTDLLSFWKPYFQGVTAKKGKKTPSFKAFTDDKNIKKVQGDKGDGVMGCILFYDYYRCVDLKINKIKKNTYINTEKKEIDPQPVTPLSPCDKKSSSATIKQDIQGVKTPKNPVTPSNSNIPTNPIGINGKSDRDLQYFEDPVCNDIVECSQESVLKYIQKHPNYKFDELLQKFGAGVMKLKAEGIL